MACYQHERDKTPRPNNQLFVIDLRAIIHMGVSTLAHAGTEGGSWEVCNSHTSCLAPFGQSNVYKMLLGQAISGPNPPMTWLRLRFGSASVCSQHEISYPASNALPPPSLHSPLYSPPLLFPLLSLHTSLLLATI